MSAPPLNHDRLVAIINMIASDNDNEMLVAARKLRTMAKERGQLVVEFLRANLAPAARRPDYSGGAYERSRAERQREEDIMRRGEQAAREQEARNRARAEELRRAMREQEAREQRRREEREKAAADKRQAEEAARARQEQGKAKPASSPWDDIEDDNASDDWGVEDWPHPGLDKDDRRIVNTILAKCRLSAWAKGFLESVLAQKYDLTPRQQAKLDEIIDENRAGGW